MQEIHTQEEWRTVLTERGQGTTRPVAVQEVDLQGEPRESFLGSWKGSLFLGCTLGEGCAETVSRAGAWVLPQLGGFRFSTHRARLYTSDELYDGFDPSREDGYRSSFDAGVYREYMQQGKEPSPDIRVTLARRLHDHSITDALHEALHGQQVVAVMGGHALERAAPLYGRICRIARALTRDGFTIVTGGGPGAMEAAHLGAALAAAEDARLDQALKALAPRPPGGKPGKEYADLDWVHRAWRVREQFVEPSDTYPQSVGIPTWLYGHEPPTVFAPLQAKYFSNAIREDGLLAIASHGVVFAPGSAGTIQEIFQDATQNHYQTMGGCAPMVLLDKIYWTERYPVWPLLQALSSGKDWHNHLFLCDDEAEVCKHLASDPISSAQSKGIFV